MYNQSIHIFNPQLPQPYFPNAIIDETSQQQPDINQKWQQFHDASTGHDYWYDSQANRSTWTQPTALKQSVSEADDCLLMGAACAESDDDESSECDAETSSEEEDENESDLPNLFPYSSDQYEPQQKMNEDQAALMTIDASHAIGDNDNALWHMAASQGDNYLFAIYAEHYFRGNKNKKKKLMIKFEAYNKFKPSLHKMNSKLNKQSKQIWKNINSYMLLRKSSKSDSGHVDKLLRWALNAPQILRDELFCQIVKQTNGNPHFDSTLKGWKLMCLFCSTFPPSAQLAPFLATYILNNTKNIGEGAECALFALKALDSTMISGPRLSAPSDLEIQSIEQRQPIPLKLCYLDGSFHRLLVTSQTQTRHILEEMAKELHLNFAQSYGIFCFSQDANRLLEENERIMDVYSASNAKEVRFIFKCKIHSSIQRNSYSYNDWRHSFLTLNYNVVHGAFPLQEQDYYHLAAIQIQGKYGSKDKNFFRAGLLTNVLDEYVPNTLIMKDNRAAIEANILSKIVLYQSLDQKNAFKKYFAYLSTCSNSYCYFDCSFFRCKQQLSSPHKANKDDNNDVLIGISEREILFVNPATLAITNRYKLDEIQTFGFRENAFLFVVGSIMKQQRMYLSTRRGKEINDLLAQHIEIKTRDTK